MSAPSLFRPLLRALACLLLVFSVCSVQAAQVKFTSGNWPGGIALSGEGGSTALPGLTLQVLNSDVDGSTPVGVIRFEDNSFFTSPDPTFGALTHDQNNAGRLAMVVKSASGRPFSLKSFTYFNWGEVDGSTYQVRGYRSGAAAPGATYSFAQPTFAPVPVVLPASFDTVDEVRVLLTSDGANLNKHTWHAINDLQVEVPNSAPTNITLSAATVNQSAGANATVGVLNSTDPDIGSSFTYTLVSGAGSTNNASFTLNNGTLRATAPATLAAGDYSVRVRTTDEYNLYVEKAFTITVVDDLAPTITGLAPSGSPVATATSVDFTATFSEAVTGVSADDFTIVASGTAAGTISSVTTADNIVYTVAVTGITGNGTLKLALNSATDIRDAASNAAPAYNGGTAHTVAIPTAPGAPTIGAVTASDAQVSVAFTAPASDGGSAITSYTATSTPGNFSASGAATPLTVTGLANGTAYSFTVTATNAVGTSVASASSVQATPKAPQTITFNSPGTQNFGTTPTLTATSNSGLPVTFASTTTGVCTTTSGGTLTFVSSGVCTINADQAGNSIYLAAAQISHSFTVAAVAPGAPTIGTAVAGDTQASVTFTAPANTGGAAITGYTVTASPGGNTGTGASSPIIVTGLTNGVSYTFSVTATSSAATGDASSASNPITPKASQAVTFNNPGAQNFGTTPTLTATADSGLTPTFSSSTTGTCTITGNGALTLLGAGSCTIVANQAGNGSYLPAAPVAQSFPVNAVVPGAPTIGTATPSGTGEIEVSFTAPTFTGGAAITNYTVTSTPGGLTGTGAGSPVRVSGLTVGQSYTFTVTATNSAGSGAASAPSNGALAADAIGANASNQTVAYGTATVVTLDISGVPTSVTVIAPPTHGTVAVTALDITYTPTPGYAGSDAFSYQATDGNTTSAAAVVSITVSPPTVTLATSSIPAGTAGSDYAQTLSSTGGMAPYRYQVTGTLPNGVSLSPDGVLSGAPTAAGSYNFNVTVTDSSTGTGPFSTTRAYTLTVAAPQIGFTLPTLPQPFTAAGYNQRLQVSGGAAPYSFVLSGGALPTGLSLASDGLLSGTATAAGSYTFVVTVTDANGFTASQSYTMVVIEAVQQISTFVANPSAPTYSVDGRFALSASGGASGNPVVFASTTPTVCRVEGSSVVMVSAGRCSLTANQAGNAQYQAAAQATLEVDITAAVPVLQWPQELQKLYGEAAFDLVDPVSPSRGGFSYSSNAPNVASVQGRTVTLHGEGVAIITVTQAAAGGFSVGTAQLRLSVTQRPDPTRDPGVVAGVQAQVDASVRFASAQQSNIRDRLRQVRSGDNTSSNQLSLGYAGSRDRPGLALPLAPVQAMPWPTLPAGWGLWASGSASVGDGDRSSSYAFHTDGISMGLDRAVGERLLLGVAASLARNDSEMDGGGSRVEGKQHSLAAYGLWRGGEHLFVDGVVAGGALDFDTRRWSNDVAAYGRGSRDGDQWFGSLAFGYEHRNAGMTLTGYGRVEASRTTLDAYRENGLGLYDLDYRRQVVRNSAVALGLEGTYLPGDGEGRVRPFWSIEYRQAIDDQGQAYLNYVVGPRAQDYQLDLHTYNDNALSIAAGMDVRLQRGWLLSLLLGHEQTRGSSRASSVGLRVSYGSAGAAAGTSATATDAATATVEATHCNRRRCPTAPNAGR